MNTASIRAHCGVIVRLRQFDREPGGSCTIQAMRCIRNTVRIAALITIMSPALAAPTAELDMIMPVLPIDRTVAEQIVELVSENSGVKINLVPPPEGDVSIPEALEIGYGDIAIVLNNEQFREGVATVMPLYPSVLQIVTPATRPANDVYELLSDANIYAGPRGSISRTLAEQTVSDLELKPGEVRFVDNQSMDADVVVIYAPIDRQRLVSDPRVRGLKMFSFGVPDDIGQGGIIDRAVLLNPRLRPFVIPVGTFGDLTPEPVLTIAVDNLLVARSDLNPAVIYDLYAEILRLRPALFGARPELFQPIDDDISQFNFAFSLHPGALAFLKRDEPSVIERYSGVAEVVATLMVGIVSGVFAFVKIYRVRRKNRLDEFLVEVIAIRNSVTAETTSQERKEAVEKIRALQDFGFEQLVDEKLAADESFRIFIELTNDTIDYIQGARSPG